MKKLAFVHVKPELERRYEKSSILRELRFSIGKVLRVRKDLKDTPLYEGKLEKQKTCRICSPKKKKRKTIFQCYLCGDPICLQCCKTVCSKCMEN